MEFGSSFGLLSIILFLLPGLAGIKLGLRVAERGDWLSRLETTGLSFGLSLSAMLAIYAAYSVIQSYSKSKIYLLNLNDIEAIVSGVPQLILTYFILILFALVGGYILGVVDFGGRHFDPILPWGRFHQLAENSGDGETYEVRVRTMAGEELRGKVEDEGEAALNKDIILENPRKLRFSEEGSVVDDRSWTGNAYIHSQSIAHVEFDRLEDADESEARGYSRQKQQTLDSSTEEGNDDEMEELEKLAEEGRDERKYEQNENEGDS